MFIQQLINYLNINEDIRNQGIEVEINLNNALNIQNKIWKNRLR